MLKRYERNLNSLSEDEVLSLSSKKVCIAGCGGLGGYILEHLARIGVGNLTVIDGDVFEESNLNRQILSDEDSLGMGKSETAKHRVGKINPLVNVKDYRIYLDEQNSIEIFSGHDVVVDALDNIKSKIMIQETCKKLNIPFVHGSIAGWYGQISAIFPGDDTLNFIYKGQSDHGIEKELGNLSFTASVVASFQSAEVVKILLNKGNLVRNALLLVDLLNMEFEEIRFNQ
ncbi:MAG: HesA/MoeB/ThiF family protein [Oscillospiraceae bacterium]|nr:HesA/MoeB/ThiF family protein [Oscillospiraceae bacterium]